MAVTTSITPQGLGRGRRDARNCAALGVLPTRAPATRAPLPARPGWAPSLTPAQGPRFSLALDLSPCTLCTQLSIKFFPRMMSTESANSFTLIGEASDGGTMENLSRRLKASLT